MFGELENGQKAYRRLSNLRSLTLCNFGGPEAIFSHVSAGWTTYGTVKLNFALFLTFLLHRLQAQLIKPVKVVNRQVRDKVLAGFQ